MRVREILEYKVADLKSEAMRFQECIDEIEALRSTLIKCQKQFRWYAELHEAKGPEHAEKAARNREYEGLCSTALGLGRQGDGNDS